MSSKRFKTVFGVVVLVATATGAALQLPVDAPQNAIPPGLPQNVTPGNIDPNRVDRTIRAFPTEVQGLAAPAPVAYQGNNYNIAPSLVGAAPTPAFGYIHQFGSFQITSSTAEGMFMLTSALPFPDNRRTIDFYHAALSYVGKWNDGGVSGFVYTANIGPPVNDQRYFLFGDQDLNVRDPNSNGVRWVIYYNSQGVRTYSTTARFYRP